MSFANKLNSVFGFDRNGTSSKKLQNKRADFSIDYAIRLQQVQIECCDALRIIRTRDTAETFFYLDPPYVGTDQGHYDGYSQEDFDALLATLETLKGRFLLSSFRNKNLAEFTQRNGWNRFELSLNCPMKNRYKTDKHKVEVFTANYPINNTE
jgi:DNA adenine methylase